MSKSIYEFGPFRLDTGKRLLLQGDDVVRLTPTAYETLLRLVENNGKVLERNELMQMIWPDSFVEEANLTVFISALRKALGDTGGQNRYIVTIPGRGYQFVAAVNPVGDEEPDLIIQRETISRITVEEQEQEIVQEPLSLPARQYLVERQGQTSDAVLPATLRPRSVSGKPVAVIVLLIVVAAIAYFWTRREQGKSVTSLKSIAVLPFKSLNAKTGDEYLGLGMADALITKLSNIRQPLVRPTSAILKYSAYGQEPLAAGREMGVDALIEGSVQIDGERMRITVQLVRTSDGASLWAGTFDESFTNIFRVQDSISEQVTRALTVRLSGEEKELLAKRYTEDTEAYKLYLNGRYYWNKRTEESFKKAIEFFEQAISIDPNYAQAYAGLADALNLLASQEALLGGLSPKETFPQAKRAALRAVELDDSLAEAHAAMGTILSSECDWAASEREFKRAIELNPNYDVVHSFYGLLLITMGRMDEAMSEMKQAEKLDPLSITVKTNIGGILFRARAYDQAIEQVRKVVEVAPNFPRAHLVLGQVYEQKGMYAEAIAELQQTARLSGNRPVALAVLAHIYAVSGNRAEAIKLLEQLQQLSTERYVSPDQMAIIYAGLGDKDKVFEWLEKELEDRSLSIGLLGIEQRFDSLRNDPRFQDLLKRAGF